MGSIKGYVCLNPTKENLDSLRVGDLVKINDWKKPFRIVGVSANYAVMISKQFFGEMHYSVIEKKLWAGGCHNEMREGFFHCGKDWWLFGEPCSCFNYKFDDPKAIAKYLQTFEDGKSELSQRNAIPIQELHVKSQSNKK